MPGLHDQMISLALDGSSTCMHPILRKLDWDEMVAPGAKQALEGRILGWDYERTTAC